MIELIEKEPFTYRDPFIGETYAPSFMVKDGQEYFVCNRVVREGSGGANGNYCDESALGLERVKQFLIQNDGTYFNFFGFYDDPFDMLKEMASREHTFCSPETLLDDCRGIKGYGMGFVDFLGNRNEVSAAFHYRIYDMEMLERLKEALEPFLK